MVGRRSPVLVTMALVGVAALPPKTPVDQITDQIRKDGDVTSEFIGFGGQPSPGYAAFKRLKQVASEADLRRLVGDRSPAVRVYAFYALADRRPDQVPLDVLLARIGDVAPVETMDGCILGKSVVRDLMLGWVDARLSIDQRTVLLERLLADKKLTPAGEHALRTWRVEPRLYETLRERASDGQSAALPAVARFRRDADVPIIKRNLVGARFDALGAVAEFPAAAFLPALREMQTGLLTSRAWLLIETRDIGTLRSELPSTMVDGQNVCRLYQAVLAYPPQTALPFLERALATPPAPKRRAHALCIGATLDPAALGPFAPIAFRIWEEEHQLSPELLQALWKIDRPRALKALEQSFADPDAFTYFDVLPMLIRFVRENHPAPARVLNQAIAGAGPSHFQAVAAAVGALRDPSSLPLLFDRLLKREKDGRVVAEGNPNIYEYDLDAILKYPLDAKQKRRLADWIVDRSPERRAQWILKDDYKQLNQLEEGLRARISTFHLDGPHAAPR